MDSFIQYIRPKEEFVSAFVDEYNRLKRYEPHLIRRFNEYGDEKDLIDGKGFFIERGVIFQLSVRRVSRSIKYFLDTNMERVHEFYYALTGDSDYIGKYRNAVVRLNINQTRAQDNSTIEEFAEKIYDEYTSIGYLF